MKVLCPKCNKPIALNVLERDGVEMGLCKSCNIMLYATYEDKSGHKIWDVHLEKPAPKKTAKGSDGGCLEAVFRFVILTFLTLLFYQYCDPSTLR